MKVSVLIPAYNSEKEIYTCIRSLLEQTYHDFEVIAVDDGSTDRTGSRLDFYAKIHPELITVIHQENRGVAAARNAALKAAKGEFILFLDSDDWMKRRTLETLVAAQARYQADVVICGNVYEGRITTRRHVRRVQIPHKRTLMKMLMKDRQVRNYAWGKLIRRSLFDGLQFWEGRVFEDVQLIPQILLRAEKTVIVPDTLVHYNTRRPNSLTYSLRPDILKDMLEAFQDQARCIVAYDPTLTRPARVMLARVRLVIGSALALHGRFDDPLMDQ
ncbi:MAG: glycosyltransferase family 2 protein, partial [Holdemania filiformis]